MAYKVLTKIIIMKGNEIINSEETTFGELNFEKMTRAAAEYYELLAKIDKVVK